MKALFNEAYYREFWGRFLERVPGEHYINMEEELEMLMTPYKGIELPEQAVAGIEKMMAEKVAARCRELVLREKKTLEAVMTGEASFGYTTHRQERQHLFELRTRFEFNCLQLADFRKKYGI